MTSTKKFNRGDQIKVVKHTVKVDEIDLPIEGFYGTVISESVNKDGVPYVTIDGEGQFCGTREIAREFVVYREEEDDEDTPEFDGVDYTINCCDCGEPRKVKPQHVNQVTRCKECQKKHNAEKARERAGKRYHKIKRESTMKKAQFRDDRGNWQDLPIVDYRITPESLAFESAKKGLITRVVEYKPNGKMEVIRRFRQQQKGLK